VQAFKSTEFYQLLASGRVNTKSLERLISPTFKILNMVIQEARARENGFESWEFKLPRDFHLSYVLLYSENPEDKLNVIGFLRLWSYKKAGYINMVRIHPKYRGKGLC
jgi:ribosomal protein S18 acetylase RimI-like enzyme